MEAITIPNCRSQSVVLEQRLRWETLVGLVLEPEVGTKEPESAPQTAKPGSIPPPQCSLRVAHGSSVIAHVKAAAAQVSRQTWKTSFSTGTIDYCGNIRFTDTQKIFVPLRSSCGLQCMTLPSIKIRRSRIEVRKACKLKNCRGCQYQYHENNEECGPDTVDTMLSHYPFLISCEHTNPKVFSLSNNSNSETINQQEY